ncbi:CHAT domain-containing protein [Lactarius quietus]|nr:CHAT domain-containing protein [Lactarius quietus]
MEPRSNFSPGLGLTLPEIDEVILEYHRLHKSLPRSDPDRSMLLHQLAKQQIKRNSLSDQKCDLDKAIIHFTEAILLRCQPSQDVVYIFCQLAATLVSRFALYQHSDDIKSSVKYFRFLRINSHLLEVFHIPRRGELMLRFFQALVFYSVLGSVNTIQAMEEMLDLIPEILTAHVSTFAWMEAMEGFSGAVTQAGIFRRKDTQQLADRVIQTLREAAVLKPDLHTSYTLAKCLSERFRRTHMIIDYEEAIDIADKIVATHSPGDSLTRTQKKTILLTSVLLSSRLNSYSKPEYFEDAFHRIRSFIHLPSLPDEIRTQLAVVLEFYARQRVSYFGTTANSGESPPNPPFLSIPILALQNDAIPGVGQEPDLWSQIQEKADDLRNIHIAFLKGEIRDVEAAVELGRKLLPLQRSGDQFDAPDNSFHLASTFADILFRAYECTKRSDYLDEAINAYHDLLRLSAPKALCFHVGHMLFRSLITRFKLFHLREDVQEFMELCPRLANDDSGDVLTRFQVSCTWAVAARVHMHPSVSIAYETAMSLLQETLVFSPTLQTQHLRLADAFHGGNSRGLSSDYVSFQIAKGRFKEAIETLERGRALLWSEMRGFRSSPDQLRAADPGLADKFEDINQRLASVTMTVAQSDNFLGDSETGRREHSLGHLIPTQRRLLEERNSLISHIQSFPGLENFLKLPSFDVLTAAAVQGPVIIINQSHFRSFVLILRLLNGSPDLSVFSTPSDFHDRADRLKEELLRIRKEKGLDSEEYNLSLAHVLTELYDLVGKPVIERLRLLRIPEKSRVWWCPTDAFCSLPLHAMGPIPSGDDDDHKVYFMDLYITSYTPTLSALIESRRPRSLPAKFDNPPLPETSDKPSLLLVAQPDTLDGAWKEIENIQATKIPVTLLSSAMATPKTVVERLRDHKFAHFVCHGLLETGKPFDASFDLHGGSLTLLEIVRSQLPTAEFAFLSACHTAELTEDSVADEGLHLAAAMQYCGFRSVVGTMWAMADTDGADLSKYFYQSIFSESKGRKRVPYHERSAKALQTAVRKLRKMRGVTLERWVNFVHYGA